MTTPDIALNATTNIPAVARTAEEALLRFQGVLRQLQSSQVAGTPGAGVLAAMTQHYEQAARRFSSASTQVVKDTNRAIGAKDSRGGGRLRTPVVVDSKISGLGGEMLTTMAAQMDAALVAARRLGVPESVVRDAGRNLALAADQLVAGTIADATEQVRQRKATTRNRVTGATGLGDYHVYSEERSAARQRQAVMPINTPLLEAQAAKYGMGAEDRALVADQMYSTAKAHETSVRNETAARAKATQAVDRQRKLEEEVNRNLRANTGDQGKLRNPRGAAVYEGHRARAMDVMPPDSDQVRSQVWTDRKGRVYGRPVERYETEEGTKWREVKNAGLVKLADSRLEAVRKAAADPAAATVSALKLQAEMDKGQKQIEEARLEEVKRFNQETLRSQLDAGKRAGRVGRQGKFLIDHDSGEVFNAARGSDRASPVTNLEVVKKAQLDYAKAMELEANRLRKQSASTTATEAERRYAQAKMGEAQRTARRAADIAGVPYGPGAAGPAPSLGFGAGKGGGSGRGPLYDALRGAGPGGTGGGLFTQQRLLRQGVSFGGYMISAAALGALMGTIADTVAEAKRFEDAMTDLAVALGTTERPSSQFIADLGEISRLAGENVSVAMETAARGIRAFGDAANEMNTDGNQRIGLAVADAAAQLAVIADKGLEDATGDLIAVGRAFEIGAEGLTQFTDAVAVAKQLGGAPNAIAQGTASAAQIMSEAGFTLQETSSIVSSIQAQTDLAPRAIATRMQRILSSLGGTAGRSVIEELNQQVSAELQIDPSGPLRDQLFGLAEAYQAVSEAQQGSIRNKVGGRSATTELVAFFDTYEKVLGSVDAAQGEAGQGAAEFQRRLDSFAGTLKQLVGAWTQFQTNLVNSGAFDAIGIALEFGLKPVLNLANDLLSTFNLLWRPVKTLTILLAEAALAMNVMAKSGMALGASGLFGMGARRGVGGAGMSFGTRHAVGSVGMNLMAGAHARAPVTGLARLAQPMRLRQFGPAAVGGYAAAGNLARWRATQAAMTGLEVGASKLTSKLGSARAGFNAFGASVGGLVTILLGGALLIKSAWDASQQAAEQQGLALDALSQRDPGGTAARRQLADSLESSAAQARTSGVIGRVLYGTDQLAASLDRRAAGLLATADRVEAEMRAAGVSSDPADVFDLSAIGGVSQGLEVLEASGRSATTQIDALIEAFWNLAGASNDLAYSLNPAQGASAAGTAKFEADRGLTGLSQQLMGQSTGAENGYFDFLWTSDAEAALRDQANGIREVLGGGFLEELEESLAASIAQAGGTVDAGLRESLIDEAVRQFTEDFAASGAAELPADTMAAVQNVLMNAVVSGLNAFKPSEQELVNAEIQSGLNEGAAVIARSRQELETLDAGGVGLGAGVDRAAATIRQLTELRNAAVALGANEEALEQHDIRLAQAELDLIQAQEGLIQAMADAAMADIAASDKMGQMQVQLSAAQQSLALGGPAERVRALRNQIASIEQQMRAEALRVAQAARLAAADPADTMHLSRVGAQNAQDEVDFLTSEGDTSSADYYNAVAGAKAAAHEVSTQAAAARNQAALDRAAKAIARRNSQIAAGSPLAQARADLQSAMDNLEAQISGSTEYYDALTALNTAKLALADQEAQLTNNLALLGIDGSNPLERARVAVEQAQAQLARDIGRGADQLVVTGSELALEDAIANAEQTYFTQRMSRLRTDMDLGRSTRAQYLNGLEQLAGELRSIEGRTFQQQELLDQLDLAIKAANAAANGQFNLGDIDVPTPFEARRAVQQSIGHLRLASGQTAVVDNRDITVVINGGDLEQVRRELQRALGSSLAVSPTLTGSRI